MKLFKMFAIIIVFTLPPDTQNTNLPNQVLVFCDDGIRFQIFDSVVSL